MSEQLSIFHLDENGQLLSTEVTPSKLSPDSQVIIHNFLLNGKYRLNYLEWRLFYCMAASIGEGATEFGEYYLRVQDIIKISNLKSGNHLYEDISKHIQNLMKHVVVWEEVPGQKSYANLVAKAKYFTNEGIVMLKPHADMVPYLLQLKRDFTTASLQYCASFKNSYSSRLYMLLKQFDSVSSGFRIMSIQELRSKLGLDYTEELSKGRKIEVSLHKEWYDLKRHVLEKAQKEIAKTDIPFDFEAIKKGRSVVAVRFILKKGKKIAATAPKALELPKLSVDQQRLHDRLKGDPFKFTDYQVNVILNNGTSKDIWQTIHDVMTTERDSNGNTIKKKSAYAYGVFKKKFGLL